MKKIHLLHHFKNEHFWFGVTNPLGDLIAGTWADGHDVQKSGTTKNLHEEKSEDREPALR